MPTGSRFLNGRLKPLSVLLYFVPAMAILYFTLGKGGRETSKNHWASLQSHMGISDDNVALARLILKKHYLGRERTIYDASGDRETRCAGVSLPESAAAPRKMDQKNGGQVWYLPLIKREGIPDLLNDLGLVGYGAEVGALKGVGAERILSRWRGAKLILADLWDAVDIWSHDQGKTHFNEMLGRVKNFPGRYEIEKGWSHEIAAKYPDGFFDFVYIDAGHSYLDVRKDLIAWWPKLKVGGLFAGHDYYNGNVILGAGDYVYGVRDAVDEFAEVFEQRVYATHDSLEGTEDVPSWYMIKC